MLILSCLQHLVAVRLSPSTNGSSIPIGCAPHAACIVQNVLHVDLLAHTPIYYTPFFIYFFLYCFLSFWFLSFFLAFSLSLCLFFLILICYFCFDFLFYLCLFPLLFFFFFFVLRNGASGPVAYNKNKNKKEKVCPL